MIIVTPSTSSITTGSPTHTSTAYVTETPSPTVTPTPMPTSAEAYYHLAAYAYFRILLLHALNRNDQDAQIVYDTLQEKYPEYQPGHASAMLAEAFWSNYLAMHDISQACPQELNVIEEKAREILYWLDGCFHGRQALRYHEVDLCPYGQQSP